MKRIQSISALGTLTLLLTVLSACGSPAPFSNSDATSGSSTQPPMLSSTSSTVSPNSGEVTIVATDSGYDAPESIPAGVTTFRMINRGRAVHWVQLAKIPSGHTVAELEAGTTQGPSPIPSWLILTGGPNGVEPGGASIATLVLDPGQYAIVVFHPGGKNLVKPIQVTAGNKSTAPEPAADTTITLTDYAYQFTTPITEGKRTIKVENAGSQAHEAALVQLAPGKSAKDFVAWEQGGEKGAKPGTFFSGMTGISKGLHGYFTVDVTPGNYLLICYVPDVRDGKPHYQHGMYRQFSVP